MMYPNNIAYNTEGGSVSNHFDWIRTYLSFSTSGKTSTIDFSESSYNSGICNIAVCGSSSYGNYVLGEDGRLHKVL